MQQPNSHMQQLQLLRKQWHPLRRQQDQVTCVPHDSSSIAWCITFRLYIWYVRLDALYYYILHVIK
jgi:hypothetical protein